VLSYVDPASGAGTPHLPEWLTTAAERTQLYPALTGAVRYAHTGSDLAESGDAFGGRRDPRIEPVVFLQVAESLPVYWGLRSADLDLTAQALAAVWHYLGIERGSTVAFFEYASAPVVAFASAPYLPHLGAGAADLLGCTAICNDGLPELADRCVHLLEYCRPSTLFVAAEAVEALIAALRPETPRPALVVVSSDDTVGTAAQLDDWQHRLGAPLTQLWRSDPALLFAPACRESRGVFHPPPQHLVESLEVGGEPEMLCVTNLVVESSVVIRYSGGLSGRVVAEPCPCGTAWPSVEIDDV
jgi:phenylacetate-coenzyme A ligase PaaK-like adenylate-forming protein